MLGCLGNRYWSYLSYKERRTGTGSVAGQKRSGFDAFLNQ